MKGKGYSQRLGRIHVETRIDDRESSPQILGEISNLDSRGVCCAEALTDLTVSELRDLHYLIGRALQAADQS